MGTPGYMAPEMIEPNTAGYNGQAVDIFALGVVLFQMVTKSTPFSHLSLLRPKQLLINVDPWYRLFIKDKETYW